MRGAGVDAIIGRIEQAIATYPYENSYRIWPGPNSNTFTAFVLRQVPELRVDLPAHAVGKDYLGARVFARPPSGTGAQASIVGVLGLLAAAEEGLEVNVLGLTFGLDPSDLALKLPLVGSIGFDGWDTARLCLLFDGVPSGMDTALSGAPGWTRTSGPEIRRPAVVVMGLRRLSVSRPRDPTRYTLSRLA